jgi:PAS domain S-box-containing protein
MASDEEGSSPRVRPGGFHAPTSGAAGRRWTRDIRHSDREWDGGPVKARETDSQVSAAHASAILENTPNGVLLVDGEARIRFVNPAFRQMFHCGEEDLLGKPASEFVHSDCFERAIASRGNLMVRETIPEHDVSFRVGLFPIEGEGLYCGIFIDISDEEKARRNFRELRAQTLKRAQEVISRQMVTAQEIARLLGESTAETKVLLVKLMSLFREEGPQ